MPSALSSALLAEAVKVHSTNPWIWLFEVQVTATTAFRITPYQGDVTTYEGTSAPYTARTWEAYNGSPPTIKRNVDGSLDSVELVVANVSAFISGYLDSNDVTGLNVRVLLVHSSNLGDSNNKTALAVDEDFQITQVGPVTMESVTLQLGHWNLIRKQFPSVRYNRNRCRFAFKDGWCAFPSTGVLAKTGISGGFDMVLVSLTECDKGLSTPNGCKGHGELEELNALPKLHPRRFGGFPGIPKSQTI